MNPADAPQNLESLLIYKEQEKWRLLAQGQIAALADLYAEDFINIGWTPTGMVRQTRQDAFAALDTLPRGQAAARLSDLHVLQVNEQTAIVTYKVVAPFATLWATSIWAVRDHTWKTVFYQASPLQEPA